MHKPVLDPRAVGFDICLEELTRLSRAFAIVAEEGGIGATVSPWLILQAYKALSNTVSRIEEERLLDEDGREGPPLPAYFRGGMFADAIEGIKEALEISEGTFKVDLPPDAHPTLRALNEPVPERFDLLSKKSGRWKAGVL